jgi:hypothetical protein
LTISGLDELECKFFSLELFTMTNKNKAVLRLAVRTAIYSGLILAPVASFALGLAPTKLVVSHTYYTGTTNPITAGVTQLPGKTAGTPSTAIAGSGYTTVWKNTTPDGSFGITSPWYLSTVNAANGATISTVNLTAYAASQGVNYVTSFSSKSEGALNFSTDGSSLSLIGYNSTVGNLDISNSNTPGLIDTTNPTYGFNSATYRTIAQLNSNGTVNYLFTDAYSGNNGRAAILDNKTGTYYLAGNAGNSGTSPANATLCALSANTGVQALPANGSTTTSTVVGALQGGGAGCTATGYQYGYSVSQYSYKGVVNPADKTGKDDNFRGLTHYNNTLYVTKGSGSNGINTVFQVGNGNDFDTLGTTSPIFVLPGFPTSPAKTVTPVNYPFALWFANPTTLYVADEGNGAYPFAATGNEGLQKWILNTTTGTWSLAYTLTAGLNLGVNYTVSGTAPDGTAGAYITAPSGLRQLTGLANPNNGTVTFYATTATVSNSGDNGADPNQLVTITDNVATTSLPASEKFRVLQTATFGEVLRGVAVLPATSFLLP